MAIFFTCFQEVLENYFTSWVVLEEHEEVVRYACALLEDNRVLVEILSKRRAKFIMYNHTDCIIIPSLLESVAAELPNACSMNPINNEIISYTTFNNRIASVPSKLHVVHSHYPPFCKPPLLKQKITFKESSISTDSSVSSSKCVLKVRSESQLVHVLKWIKDIEQRQHSQVQVHGVNIYCESHKKENKRLDNLIGAETGLSFSEDAAFVILQRCNVSQEGCKKLRECSKLKILHLFECVYAPEQLAETIEIMKSLVSLKITHDEEEMKEIPGTGRALAAAIVSFDKLEDLHTSGISWKSLLSTFFPDSVFHQLKEFRLERADLHEDDLAALSQAFQDKRLPVLKELSLEGNTLTSCLVHLIGEDDHPEFACLEVLDLSETKLA